MRHFISFITTFAFILLSTPMAFAQDNRFASGDPFANRNSAHVGLYLKIPFAGGLRNYKKDKIKFGAALGFKRSYSTDYRSNISAFNTRRQITLNVLDLKFNERGFKTVSLVGQDLSGLKNGDIVFLEDEKGGVTAGKVVLYTLAAVGGAIIIGAAIFAIQLSNNDCWPLTCDKNGNLF